MYSLSCFLAISSFFLGFSIMPGELTCSRQSRSYMKPFGFLSRISSRYFSLLSFLNVWINLWDLDRPIFCYFGFFQATCCCGKFNSLYLVSILPCFSSLYVFVNCDSTLPKSFFLAKVPVGLGANYDGAVRAAVTAASAFCLIV